MGLGFAVTASLGMPGKGCTVGGSGVSFNVLTSNPCVAKGGAGSGAGGDGGTGFRAPIV